MAERKYKAPEGCTSIFIAGETVNVGKKGVIVVSDAAPHDEMLSHGFTPLFGDDDGADAAALAAAKALEGGA